MMDFSSRIPRIRSRPEMAEPIILKNGETGEELAYPQVAAVLLSDTIFSNLVVAIVGGVMRELERRGVIAPEESSDGEDEATA